MKSFIELESKSHMPEPTLSNEEFQMLQDTVFASPDSLLKMDKLTSETIEKLLLKPNKKGIYLSEILKNLPNIFSELLKKVNSTVIDIILIEQTLSVHHLIAACKLTNTTNAIDIAVSKINAHKYPTIMSIVEANWDAAAEILAKMSVNKLDELITTPFGKQKQNLLHGLTIQSKNNPEKSLDPIYQLLAKASSEAIRKSLFLWNDHNCSSLYFLFNHNNPAVCDLVKAIITKAKLDDESLGELFITPQYDNAALLMYGVTDKTMMPLVSFILEKLNTSQMQWVVALQSESKKATLLPWIRDVNLLKKIYSTVGVTSFSQAICLQNSRGNFALYDYLRDGNIENVEFVLKHIDGKYLARIFDEKLFRLFVEKDNPELLHLLLNKIDAKHFQAFIKNHYAGVSIKFNLSSFLVVLNHCPDQYENFLRYFEKSESLNRLLQNLFTNFNNVNQFTKQLHNAWIYLSNSQLKLLQETKNFEKIDEVLLFQYKIHLSAGEQDNSLKCVEQMQNQNLLDIHTEFEVINLYRTKYLMLRNENNQNNDDGCELSALIDKMKMHAESLLKKVKASNNENDKAIEADTLKICHTLLAKHDSKFKISVSESKFDSEHLRKTISANAQENFSKHLNEMFAFIKKTKSKGSSFFSSKNKNIYERQNIIFNTLKFSSHEEGLKIINDAIAKPTGIKEFDDLIIKLKSDLVRGSNNLNAIVTSSPQLT